MTLSAQTLLVFSWTKNPSGHDNFLCQFGFVWDSSGSICLNKYDRYVHMWTVVAPRVA